MSKLNIEPILKQVEALLAQAGALPTEAEQAVEKLLNVVEALSSDKKELADEVERLRQELEKKKRAKRPPIQRIKTTKSRKTIRTIHPKIVDHGTRKTVRLATGVLSRI